MTKKSDSFIDQKDLKSLAKLFRQNWYILVACLVMASLVAYLYTYKLPDVFAARAQVLLKSGETYDYQAGIHRSVGYYMSYENISNQSRILKSYNLIDKAISKLNLDVSYYIIGRLKTSEVYQAMPFHIDVHYMNTGLYEQPVKFRILDKNTFRISYELEGKNYEGDYAFDSNVRDNNMFIRVSKNDLLDKTIESIKEIDYEFVAHSRSNLIYKYMQALSVENLEYTTVLQLTLEDEIPSRAVTFLDTLSREYINYTLQSQIDINENTLRYIDKQLNEVVDILSGIEDEMEDYRRDKAILNLSKEEDAYFSKMLDYDSKKRDLILQLQSIDALENYIRENQGVKDDRLLPPSVYVDDNDDFLKKNMNELYTLQLKRNTGLFAAKEASVGIKQVDDQIELLKKDILIYLFNLKKALTSKIKDFNQQLSQYEVLIKAIPKTQRDILNINRKLQVNEKMYLYLLEKKANTIIARAGIIPETKLIETARSIGRVKPDKGKLFRLFLIGGGMLGLVLVGVRFLFFNRIETVDELKEVTSLPVLGEIIYSNEVEAGKPLVIETTPRAAITESFRALRTNLEYVISDEQSRTILITSHSPSEGKTFCSLNLASILAKAGKRVLMLELDLHKPKVRKALQFDSGHEQGVSSILAGKTTAIEVINKDVIENLDIILAGPPPPNASELILSPKLKELLEYGEANYDYVIVDSAPIGLITDAIVLMKHVDATLFIVNVKSARRDYIKAAEELVITNELKNFGFVLNGVRLKQSRYYYNYSYGYRYGYSYGYG